MTPEGWLGQANTVPGPDGRPVMACDDPECTAYAFPETLEEYKVTLEHWQSHWYNAGCAHAW
jgi:hypothetical protein